MSSMVIGVVPARMGSTRFPGKLLRIVAGKPLVIHAFERLSAAEKVCDTFIATDSDEIEQVALEYGARAVRVDEPCHSGTDRMARSLRGRDFEIAVNLQGDQPVIEPSEIDRVVAALQADPSLDVTTVAYHDRDGEAFESRDVVKVVADGSGRALYFSRAPIPSSKSGEAGKVLFLHHVGIYCFRRGPLARFAELPPGDLERRESLEQLRALEAGMSIGLVVTGRALPDVDRPSDLAKVERLLQGS